MAQEEKMGFWIGQDFGHFISEARLSSTRQFGFKFKSGQLKNIPLALMTGCKEL